MTLNEIVCVGETTALVLQDKGISHCAGWDEKKLHTVLGEGACKTQFLPTPVFEPARVQTALSFRAKVHVL